MTKKMMMFVAVCVLLAAPAAAVASHKSQNTHTHADSGFRHADDPPYFTDYGSLYGRVRPSTIWGPERLLAITHLHWSRWGGPTVTGTGYWGGCSSGCSNRIVNITLGNVKTFTYHCPGYPSWSPRAYTSATVHLVASKLDVTFSGGGPGYECS
jgi:hypothetical protein